MEVELQVCYQTIEAFKKQKEQILQKHGLDHKEWDNNTQKKLDAQKDAYETKIERQLGMVEQLISDKASLAKELDEVVQDKVDCDSIIKRREKEMQDRYNIELKKSKDLWMASEKLRREKWMKDKEKVRRRATTHLIDYLHLIHIFRRSKNLQLKELSPIFRI